MRQSDIDTFTRHASQDAALQALLAGAGDEATFVQRAVAVARDAGLDVSADQVQALITQPGEVRELSDRELDAVAAGYVSFGSSLLCGFCGSQSGTCSSSLLRKLTS